MSWMVSCQIKLNYTSVNMHKSQIKCEWSVIEIVRMGNRPTKKKKEKEAAEKDGTEMQAPKKTFSLAFTSDPL